MSTNIFSKRILIFSIGSVLILLCSYNILNMPQTPPKNQVPTEETVLSEDDVQDIELWLHATKDLEFRVSSSPQRPFFE